MDDDWNEEICQNDIQDIKNMKSDIIRQKQQEEQKKQEAITAKIADFTTRAKIEQPKRPEFEKRIPEQKDIKARKGINALLDLISQSAPTAERKAAKEAAVREYRKKNAKSRR